MTIGLPDFPVATFDTMLPVPFEVPPINPAPGGLYPHVIWTETGPDEPSRQLNGVQIRPAGNYGGDNAFGVWDTPWCSVPELDGDRKEGTRPGGLDPFEPMTVWAYDQCDLTAPSRAEVQARAAQIMRLEEQVAVERGLAARLLLDAADLPGPIQTAASFKLAVGYLEGQMALTNTLGFFHAGAQWVSQEFGLVIKSGTRWTSPLGHVWIFGGGYVDGLEDTIVATSQLFGWRDQVQIRTTIDERHNTFAAIAERTVVVGYEAVVAAVEISP